MKRLSFLTIVLCMLAPPVGYIFTLNYLETYLQSKYHSELEDIYIGDSGVLLKGSVTLKNAIKEHLEVFINEKHFASWGIFVDITVTTKKGQLLYPAYYDAEENNALAKTPLHIASESYALLNEGLSVKLALQIERYGPLSLGIFLFYSGLSLLVLLYWYRTGLKQTKKDEIEKNRKIEQLQRSEIFYHDSLKGLEEKRNTLSDELASIRGELENEQQRSNKNEEDLIDEIVNLEEKVKEKRSQLDRQEEEIANLEEKIAQLEKEKGKGKGKEAKHKLKATENVERRFNTLYKSLIFHKRALAGFVDISEEFKIKAEEVIHQLNDDRSKVPIKRKVFGKKERETVFEIVFAYKGRLYYRVLKDNKIEILAIGTKNSQTKDLLFLDNL